MHALDTLTPLLIAAALVLANARAVGRFLIALARARDEFRATLKAPKPPTRHHAGAASGPSLSAPRPRRRLGPVALTEPPRSPTQEDAHQALLALGMPRQLARAAVAQCPAELSTPEIIRLCAGQRRPA